MYNFFVTAQIGAWDQQFYEYDRSRFLEYTEEKISVSFKTLTPERVEQLVAMPCLFAYEGTEHNVKIGKLTSIKERARKILIEFEFYPQVASIPFSSIKPIATLLDIRDWEMNRTHWAVKDEDLFHRLYTASLIDSQFVESAGKPSPVRNVSKSEKAPSRITTVTGFIGKVLEEKSGKSRAVFYRGHPEQF